LLQEDYAGKISTAYIDPPYNTGHSKHTGFAYNDSFQQAEDDERHSTWLNMMEPRLLLAHSLLTPAGIIMMSIDDREVHHLRMLLDQIFGEHNFIAQLVWDGGTVKNNARFISATHEYVLIYTKNMGLLDSNGTVWREPREGSEQLIARYDELCAQYGDDYDKISAELKKWVKTAPLSKRLKVFTSVDERGLYTYADLSAPGSKGGTYEVLHPVTGKPCQNPSRGWGYTQEKMEQLITENRVIFGVDETAQPLRKLYLEDKLDQVRRSILNYPARSSTHLLEHMLGRRNAFNNPKNLEMIMDLIRLVTPADGIVLDFFAGSGTTGHAVLQLNHQDDGTRQFILATSNENDICRTVTHPRLTAAITGEWGDGTLQVPLGGSLQYLQIVENPQGEEMDDTGGL
jgi:adenine-specific DNA-methyltransferase